jgi:hypothetical protein
MDHVCGVSGGYCNLGWVCFPEKEEALNNTEEIVKKFNDRSVGERLSNKGKTSVDISRTCGIGTASTLIPGMIVGIAIPKRAKTEDGGVSAVMVIYEKVYRVASIGKKGKVVLKPVKNLESLRG